jgi:hypothetical protein
MDLKTGLRLSRQARAKCDEPWQHASAQAVRWTFRQKPWFNPRDCMTPIPLPIAIALTDWSFPPPR